MEDNQRKTNDAVIALSLVRIELTEEEARKGCNKSVVSGNQQYPISIPAGTKVGDEFEIRSRNNALIGIVEVSGITKSKADTKKDKDKEKKREKSGTTGKSSKKTAILAITAVAIIALGVLGFTYFNHSVPDVSGLDSDGAQAMIEYAGLTYEESRQFSEDVPRGEVISQNVEVGSHLRKGAPVEVVISKGKPIPAPEFVGQNIKDAEKAAKKLGLSIEVEGEEFSDTLGKNLIISQDIEKDTDCEEGQVIQVVKSKGITQVEVPDVVGKTADEATSALKKAGFEYSIEEVYSSSEAGTIVEQSVAGGKTADKGASITISKSIGPQPVSSSSGKKKSSKKSSKKKKSSSSSSSWGDGDW